MVLLFIRAPFYVLLDFIAMCAVFWLFWLSYQYLPSDWLERLVCPHSFVFPWAAESSPFTVLGASLTNLNEPPRALATSTIAWVRSNLLGCCKQKQCRLMGYYVAGPPLLNERCTSLLRAPVSKRTYTVSSGTLNPSIPYHANAIPYRPLRMTTLTTAWNRIDNDIFHPFYITLSSHTEQRSRTRTTLKSWTSERLHCVCCT